MKNLLKKKGSVSNEGKTNKFRDSSKRRSIEMVQTRYLPKEENSSGTPGGRKSMLSDLSALNRNSNHSSTNANIRISKIEGSDSVVRNSLKSIDGLVIGEMNESMERSLNDLKPTLNAENSSFPRSLEQGTGFGFSLIAENNFST